MCLCTQTLDIGCDASNSWKLAPNVVRVHHRDDSQVLHKVYVMPWEPQERAFGNFRMSARVGGVWFSFLWYCLLDYSRQRPGLLPIALRSQKDWLHFSTD